MLKQKLVFCAAVLGLAGVFAGCAINPVPSAASATTPFLQAFQARGVIKELKPNDKIAVISHEEIAGYMPAMVMPFTVRDTNQLAS